MQIRSRSIGALALALTATLTVAACGSSKKADTGAAATTVAAGAATTKAATATTAAAGAATTKAGDVMADKDIVDTAVGAGSFKTLAALLTTAGLVDTLKGPGPFTVFAPTDDAFAKVDKATLDKLGANVAALKQVLTYHVVAGDVMAKDVKPGKVKTVEGSEATIAADGGKVTIDKANVIKTDIVAKNGVIHVIDAVILPADLKL
jgi:uncharacterized surface protein with fasciclin (FAS1) repeats